MGRTGQHTPALMLQGTGSDVGKSLLVAGLARAYTRRGLAVRPFKPQNMSNNAAVCEGGEIGRAQALQARAARIEPCIDMNPVLLKPQSDIGAQVIVQGRVIGNASARDYHALKPGLLPAVMDSFRRLSDNTDLVLIEGAGSPAEVNLRAGDIANMGFAEAADVPVVLVGDIERGGVIASITGTVALLPRAEQQRIKGSIVNKFRGDPSLFDDAATIIENKTGAPLLGVVPWFDGAGVLPKEDSASFDSARRWHDEAVSAPVRIGVLQLLRIANFDDLDPLAAEPGVDLQIVKPGAAIPGNLDLVIIPGSKSTRADVEFLHQQGWDGDLRAHVRRSGRVLGICGGYQMLGRTITDSSGIEGEPGTSDGLALLDIETTMAARKTLVQVNGTYGVEAIPVNGYEMHMGVTTGTDTARPFVTLQRGPDGARSADGHVMGCYVHGLFAGDAFRRSFLKTILDTGAPSIVWEETIDDALDGLADHLEAALSLDTLMELAVAR